jgi:hypothetical protein
MFGLSRLGLFQLISSHIILFNLLVKHYSFYQLNNLAISQHN